TRCRNTTRTRAPPAPARRAPGASWRRRPWAACRKAIRGVRIPRLLTRVLPAARALDHAADLLRARLDRGELLLGEVLAALAFLELQALAACLEASPGALRALLFRRQLEDACLCLAEIRDKRNVAGTDEVAARSEEHTSELQSRENLVCRLLLEKKKH